FSSLINDVEVMISVKAKEKHLEFNVTVDESMPNGLFGDDIRIKQVLVNILNNAVKYTEKGYVNIDVSYEKNGGECTVFFTIKDSGIGIKEEDIPQLFEKFDRFDMNKNKTIEGTGLGLAIVKSLLSMMNGTIDVESEYGKGSTFLLRIPQKINSDESISDYKKQYVARSADGGYKELFIAPDAEILVVDDTIVNLTVAKALLKKTLIKIDTAKNVAEALEMTKKKHYDTILLDNRMPGMDGTEALPIIRSQEDGLNHETPVVCLTADAVSGAKQRYLDEGFTDYLSKPIESASLERILLKDLPDEKIEKNR
ncbi:MAG: response regulator, partial [Lachnospiraceae bacterium]|nr:response regulator [Lachnospiraceae bacterium]